MMRTNKKEKEKPKKDKSEKKSEENDHKKTSGGIPDVDFKKLLGCG